MSATTLYYILASLLLIDILVGYATRHYPFRARFKSAGILAHIILALYLKNIYLPQKNFALFRFIISSIFCALTCFSISIIFSKFDLPSLYSKNLFLILVPAFLAPFYYLAFALAGLNYLKIKNSTVFFRKRIYLSLIFISNIIFLIAQINLSWISQIFYFIFIFLFLASQLQLLARIKRPVFTNFLTQEEDHDFGPSGCMHHMACLLENTYYILLSLKILLLTNNFLFILKDDTQNIFLFIILLIFLVTLSIRWLFHEDTIWKTSVYENFILPLGFAIFGISFAYYYY